MPIRLLSWNMKNFNNRQTLNPLLQVFLDTVNPAGVAANYDIVVVVEPQADPSQNRGDFATGQGQAAMWTMRNLLRAQHNIEWEVVPPYCLANGGKRNEAIAMFYNGDLLRLHGPDHDVAVVGAWRTPAAGGGHANVGTERAAGGTYIGRWAWVVGGAALEFETAGERRPYLVEFEELATTNRFLVVAAHSPSPGPKNNPAGKKNLHAITGTRNLGLIPETSSGRALPVVIVGDFNTCTRPTCKDFPDSISSSAHDTMAGAGAALFAEGTASSSSSLAFQYHALAVAEALLVTAAANTIPGRNKAIWVGKLGHMVDHVCGELPGVQVALRDTMRAAWRNCRMTAGLLAANAVARSNAVVAALAAFLPTVNRAGTLAGDHPETLLIRTWLVDDLATDAAALSLATAGTADEAHWARVVGLLCGYSEARIAAGGGAGTFVDAPTTLVDNASQVTSAAARLADPLNPVGDGALAAAAATNLRAVVDALSDLIVHGVMSSLAELESSVVLAELCAARAQTVATDAAAVPFAVMGGLAAARVAASAAQMNPVAGACNTAAGHATTAATAATVAGGLIAGNARLRAANAGTRARAVFAAFNALALGGATGTTRRSMTAVDNIRVAASPRVRVQFFAELAAHASGIAGANVNSALARQWALITGLAARYAVFAAASVHGAVVQLQDAIIASEAALAATNANGHTVAAAASAAIAALPARMYRTHIAQTRTSLVTSGEPMLRWRRAKNGTKLNQVSYTSHAFDHALTIGFANVTNPRFVDLFLSRMPDIGPVATGTSKQIKRSFEMLFRGTWQLVYKVSDHLPIAIDLTP